MYEEVKKMWTINTMDKYSGLKKNDILTYTTRWVNFENIIWKEISQSQMDKYLMIPLIWDT